MRNNVLKRMTAVVCLAAATLQVLCVTGAGIPSVEGSESNGDMYTRKLEVITDMVHDNPGGTPYETKYDDAAFLSSRGLSGKVFFLSEAAQLAIDWQDYDRNVFPEGSAGYNWVQAKKEELHEKYKEAKDEGLKVYFMMDFISLPSSMKSLYGDEIMTNGKIDINKAKTQEIMKEMFREIFEEFPEVDGIYPRYGESYVGYYSSYHFGNNPIGVSSTAKNDHVTLLKFFRDEVCERYGKEVVYRTWSTETGANSFTTSPELYLEITNQVEPHENLYIAIKHTAGDFWRNYTFNETIGIGNHQQIIEIQCSREYEGKGAYPNYVAGSVINGFKEYEWQMDEGEDKSLRDVVNRADSKVVGIWTWSRGGGWGGPYTNGEENPEGDELWSDLNAYVLHKWAQDTSRTDESLVKEYAREVLSMSDEDAENFYRLAVLSSDAVLYGIGTDCEPVTNPLWTRDASVNKDLFDRNLSIMFTNREGDTYPKLEEKRESVRLWEEILALAEGFDDSVAAKPYIVTTATYGYYLFSIFERMWTTGILYTEMNGRGKRNAAEIAAARTEFDDLWEAWETFEKENPSCPTLYNKSDFTAVMDQYKCGINAPAKITLSVGASAPLQATVDYYKTEDLVYSSSNESVATVDAAGNVAGVADGYAMIITATSDGQLKAATVAAVGEASSSEVLFEEDFGGYEADKILDFEKTAEDSRTNVKVVEISGDKVLKLEQTAMGDASATVFHTVKDLGALTGTVTVSLDMMTANKNSAFFCVYDSSGKFITQVDFRGDGIYVDTGGQVTKISDLPYNAMEWYNIDIVCSTDTQTFSISVNDTDPRSFTFREDAKNVGLLKVGINRSYANDAYYDNISVTRDTGSELTAEEVAALIYPTGVNYDERRLYFPAVPAGFRVSVTPGGAVDLDTDGTIYRRTADTHIEATLTVTKKSDGTTAQTAAFALDIPGAKTLDDLRILISQLRDGYGALRLSAYTKESAENFRQALASAESVAADDGADEAAVIAAIDGIFEAMDSFEAKPEENTGEASLVWLWCTIAGIAAAAVAAAVFLAVKKRKGASVKAEKSEQNE